MRGGSAGDAWERIGEAGSRPALRFALFVHRRLGPRVIRGLLWVAALYFVWRKPPVREGSRRYLARLWASPEGRRALGREPGLWRVVRHVHTFGVQVYDRMRVWSGELADIDLIHDGSGELFELARRGQGALLLGAHMGSFDMLRVVADQYDLTVNVLLYRVNAERINQFFEELAPDSRVRIIDLDPASTRAAFAIRACIERGEFVAILADRVSPEDRGRTATVTFLGQPTRFPLSPFLLPSLLGCPAYLALCLQEGPCRYRTILRSLGPAVRARRSERSKHALELLERYASLLDGFCHSHPEQWFNFFDYWGPAAEGDAASRSLP